MVNSCSILSALLVVGTVVLAVPIVPEGIVSTGMPEGAVGFQPGRRSMDAESSEPGLPIRTRRHDVISREPPSAEGWPGSQSSRLLRPREPTVEEMTDFLKDCHSLPENYRQMIDQNNRMMRSGTSSISLHERLVASETRRKIKHMYKIIKEYIHEDGPSGTSPEKLTRIRDGFEKGEDLNKLTDIVDLPNYTATPNFT
ncbi:uncharacterized protein C8R40DRAFT_1164774 [Lentinula edodes]|uniref:uncharacterized protein n=1 Tax=Lentinula edodes TaxID=5353 RepID=UPI001E8CA502|nr:uncharacterized protein C8R40DRAFT_1164774 [Lentinula edodes]KAH7881361.1 hypothetical protein C8R40DRAFT_1164774 [Lentinula edodes]